MATMYSFMKDIDDIVNETYQRQNEAEENRQTDFEAALKIQSWFRATRVRSYLKFLSFSATRIQKHWRGYLGRRYSRLLVKDGVFMMKMNHYNSLATKIQKVWRGYYVRKYVSNYYSRKRYLDGLKIKNEIVRKELTEFAAQQEKNRRAAQEEAEKKQIEDYARSHHFLVSTEAIPGIYNSPFEPYPTHMEYRLRAARPRSSKKKPSSGSKFDPACQRYDLPRLDPLPPIHPKPQGPFRDPREVQKQRYKPFQPSLRVETSFTAVEEARQKMRTDELVTRLNDNIWQPSTHKVEIYEQSLHGTSSYGHLPYGNHYFREEYPEKFAHSQNFECLVPPVPVFDKLNYTYSKGQV